MDTKNITVPPLFCSQNCISTLDMSHGTRGMNLCTQKTKQIHLDTVMVYIVSNHDVPAHGRGAWN